MEGSQGGNGKEAAAGRFVRFCAGQVFRSASRDIGSDPLLPASRCSVSQEGQTPCRTVPPSEAQGGGAATERWRSVAVSQILILNS